MSLIVKVIIGLIALIISSYLSFTIPISDTGIPFTAQSFTVFIVAGLFTPKEFLICILGYLLLGIIGLPVFAEGTSGFSKITGPSGGFLYGFLFSGFFISHFKSKINKDTWVQWLILFVLATVLLFTFGLLQLTFNFDWSRALEYGFHPFWKMGLFKGLLSSIVCFSYYRYKSKTKQTNG